MSTLCVDKGRIEVLARKKARHTTTSIMACIMSCAENHSLFCFNFACIAGKDRDKNRRRGAEYFAAAHDGTKGDVADKRDIAEIYDPQLRALCPKHLDRCPEICVTCTARFIDFAPSMASNTPAMQIRMEKAEAKAEVETETDRRAMQAK